MNAKNFIYLKLHSLERQSNFDDEIFKVQVDNYINVNTNYELGEIIVKNTENNYSNKDANFSHTPCSSKKSKRIR